jgi:adenylate cyclase
VYERLRGRYRFQDQGVVHVKGKGLMRNWLLLGAQ